MKTKTYVITGAASGIGKAVMQNLAENSIIFAGYRSQSIEAENGEISKNIYSKDIYPRNIYPRNIYPFYIDYTKPETIKEASEFILSKTSKIDTLINAAGCVVAGPVENLSMEEIRRQFNVNVFGHIELTQYLLPALTGGKIINISSMASFGLFPFISPYCASKKCLDMFFNSLLIENKKNIKVISVKPGVISTPLWKKSIDENSKYMDRCGEYKQEMNYVLANAERNQTRGLSADKVARVIIKADAAKKPKLSYIVGGDAFLAELVSKLPQNLINEIIKLGIKIKIYRNSK